MSDSSPIKPEEHKYLVQRSKQGDAYAYDSLCLYYSAQLWTFLMHMVRNEDDARDLAQETLLTAWINLPTLREESFFKTWLYRIAINKAKAFLKRNKRFAWLSWEEHEKITIPEDSSIPGIEDQVIERVMLELALEHISPTYRACLVLKYVQDLPESKIAEILEISVNDIGTIVKRAKKQLSKAYQCLRSELDVPVKGRPVQ